MVLQEDLVLNYHHALLATLVSIQTAHSVKMVHTRAQQEARLAQHVPHRRCIRSLRRKHFREYLQKPALWQARQQVSVIARCIPICIIVIVKGARPTHLLRYQMELKLKRFMFVAVGKGILERVQTQIVSHVLEDISRILFAIGREELVLLVQVVPTANSAARRQANAQVVVCIQQAQTRLVWLKIVDVRTLTLETHQLDHPTRSASCVQQESLNGTRTVGVRETNPHYVMNVQGLIVIEILLLEAQATQNVSAIQGTQEQHHQGCQGSVVTTQHPVTHVLQGSSSQRLDPCHAAHVLQICTHQQLRVPLVFRVLRSVRH
jgi:hypothetical protein